MKYCGIDLGTESTSVCVVTACGEVVKEKTVATNGAEIRKALKGFGKLHCVVEAAPLAEWLCVEVEKGRHSIDILDPRQAKAVTAGKKKTDKLDARKLAQLCRTGWYVRVHRKSGRAREMRSYLTARQQIVKMKVAATSTILGLFRAHGINVKRCEGAMFVMRVQAALKTAAPMLAEAIVPLLALWRQAREYEREMYKELGKKVKKEGNEFKLLMSVPSVGPATAAAFVATIDNPKRFPSSENVASYLGLTPSVYQSGKTEYRGRITKLGDKLLRWHLVEAAHNLLSRSRSVCRLRQWGLQLVEKKGYAKAKVAVARKLACLLYHLWLTGEEFNPAAA